MLNEILIENDSCFEFVAGQLQRYTDNILCVKDGCRIMVYESELSIPTTLEYRDHHLNNLTDITEYYYRCNETDDLYVFFRPVSILRAAKISAPRTVIRHSIDKNLKGTIINKEPDNSKSQDVNKIVIFS
jgi:hypothetical protein